MTQQINITVNITVPRPETEAERFSSFCASIGRQVNQGIANRVEREKARGNPFLKDVETYDQFIDALKAEEADKRKRLGFWKYHFFS